MPSRRRHSSEYRTPSELGSRELGSRHALAKRETIWYAIHYGNSFPNVLSGIMGIISHSCQAASQALPKAERSGGEGPPIAAVGRRKTREERRTGQPGESQDTTEGYELEFLVGGAARRS